MHSYTAKDGTEIQVSTEHLDVAVAIKLELQKASPSRRCSWKEHKKLMEKEGFDDSDTSENYRAMVNRYQIKTGQMPSLEKHVDMIATKKLESINELVGEIATEKRDNQIILRQLNKVKRQIIDGNLYTKSIIEGIQSILADYDWSAIGNTNIKPIKVKDGAVAIALVSDWHIGAIVEREDNVFNFSVAKNRVRQYIDKLKQHCEINKIKRIKVVFMGDLIEGLYMRAGQGYDVEFHTSEQIVKASELMLEMLVELSHDYVVEYMAFAGNHDRINQMDKSNNVHGDSAIVLSNEIVKTYIDSSNNPNLSFVETDCYSAVVSVNGVNAKFVHGDLEKKKDKSKIHEHSSNDNIKYDIIAYGHFHHHYLMEVGINRFELRVGSIKGVDHYADRFGLGSAPSQAVITVAKNGEIDIKRIGLK